MKLSVDLKGLIANAEQMGALIGQTSSIKWPRIDERLRDGIEVDINSLDNSSSLLMYKGRQVVLYIPDHGERVQMALNDGSTGKKFHIAHCSVLDNMKRIRRFERYIAKNNLSTEFKIHGQSIDRQPLSGVASLNVCKICLRHLNYQGAATYKKPIQQIVQNFSMAEFFATYSSVFEYMPKELALKLQAGYAKDWDEISRKARQNANYTCSDCKVDLSTARHLLHVHHINGVKQDNSQRNLQVLCAGCHRNQPLHEHILIKSEEMRTINRLRHEQRINNDTLAWPEVLKSVNPAFRDVLDLAQRRGNYAPPHVAYPVKDQNGEMIAEFEVAWPDSKFAIAINNAQKADGWYVLGLKEALAFFSQAPQHS